MPKVLVTDGVGFIGSHFVKLFPVSGFEVVILNLEEELEKTATYVREKELVA